MLVIRKWIEKFPHRSSTSTRVLLARVVKTSGYCSLVQEDCLEISCGGTVKSQRVQKSAKLLTVFKLVLHETTRSSLLLSLKSLRPAAKDSLQADTERSRTSPIAQDTKEIVKFEHIDHEQVDEKQQAVLRAKFRENLAKQNAVSKKRSTMREMSAAEEQQNRVESIMECQTEVRSSFAWKRRKLQRSRTRFKR